MRRDPKIAGILCLIGMLGVVFIPEISSAAAVMCKGKTATLVGTTGSDQGGTALVGTSGPDVIAALGGDDHVFAGGGGDLVCAGDGNDIVFGEAGADRLFGELGDIDVVSGGLGNDTLDGGIGIADEVSYLDSTTPVVADLTTKRSTGQGTDILAGIEGVFGSNLSDRLTGDGLNNFFAGGAGNDVIDGLAGTDAVLFTNSSQLVNVDLTAGTAVGEGSDQLTSIQAVSGSSFGDTLLGSAGPDILLGQDGNDVVRGRGDADTLDGEDGNDQLFGEDGDDILRGAAGADTYNGGGGTGDWATFATSIAPVSASLAAGSATGEGSDKLSGVENLAGSSFNDALTGNGVGNRITGGVGNDTISGVGGNDALIGEDGTDSAAGGAGRDYCDTESVATCEEGPAVTPSSVTAPATATAGAPPATAEVPPATADVAPASTSHGATASGDDTITAVRGMAMVQQALQGESVTAQDEFVITLWGIVLLPPECHESDRFTQIWTYQEAEGVRWRAELFYWDATQQQFFSTGASVGPLFPHRDIVYNYINYSWVDQNGNVADYAHAWTVGTEATYYGWAEYITDADGTQRSNWIMPIENFPAAGGYYYYEWCYLPT